MAVNARMVFITFPRNAFFGCINGNLLDTGDEISSKRDRNHLLHGNPGYPDGRDTQAAIKSGHLAPAGSR
jgi:hypothetical protein